MRFAPRTGTHAAIGQQATQRMHRGRRMQKFARMGACEDRYFSADAWQKFNHSVSMEGFL